VTQLLTDHNTQGGPKYQYKYTQTHNVTQTQSLIEITTQRFGPSIFWDTRRWIKSKSTIRSILTHHRQNPTEIILSLCCSLSNPYKTIRKIMCKFLDRRWEDKRLWTKWQQALLEINLISVSSWTKFWFVAVFPNIWTFPTFSKDSLATSKFSLVASCNPVLSLLCAYFQTNILSSL
jgi:hypothetical protein